MFLPMNRSGCRHEWVEQGTTTRIVNDGMRGHHCNSLIIFYCVVHSTPIFCDLIGSFQFRHYSDVCSLRCIQVF